MSNATNAPSGTQRVAAFLLSLDKASAAAVLKTLDPKIVSEVATAMTELDHSFNDKNAIDALYRELSKTLNAPSGLRAQDEGELGAMLESALGRERARTVIGEIQQRRRIERPFSILEEEPPAVLAMALAEESPAVPIVPNHAVVNLEGDRPAHRLLARLVHDREPTVTKDLEDSDASDGRRDAHLSLVSLARGSPAVIPAVTPSLRAAHQ